MGLTVFNKKKIEYVCVHSNCACVYHSNCVLYMFHSIVCLMYVFVFVYIYVSFICVMLLGKWVTFKESFKMWVS